MAITFNNIRSIGKYIVKESEPKYIFNTLSRRAPTVYATQPMLSYNNTVYKTADDGVVSTTTFNGVFSKNYTHLGGETITSVIHDGTQFIISTVNGKVYSSSDLSSYTLRFTSGSVGYPTRMVTTGTNYLLLTPETWVYHGSNLNSLVQTGIERSMTDCCTDGTYWYICTSGGSAYGNYVKRFPVGGGSSLTLTSNGSNTSDSKFQSIAHNAGTLLVGAAATIYRSTSASGYSSWSTINAPGAGGYIYKIAYANGNWYALSAGISRSVNDGVNWSSVTISSRVVWMHLHVVDANTLYVIGSQGESATSSDNGATWTMISEFSHSHLSAIVKSYANTICISDFGSLIYKKLGNSCVYSTTAGNYAYSMVANQTGIYATLEAELNTTPMISKSTNDGNSFLAVNGPGTNNFEAEREYTMATNGISTIVAGLNTTEISRTIDGTTWVNTGLILYSGTKPSTVYYVNNKFFAFGYSQTGSPNYITHAISPDGVTWQTYDTFKYPIIGRTVTGMAFTGSHYYVIMNENTSNKIYRSVDGITWTSVPSNLDGVVGYSYTRAEIHPSGMVYDGYNLVICTDGGHIMKSSDGSTWEIKHTNEYQFFSIAKFGDDIYALGAYGTLVHTSLID